MAEHSVVPTAARPDAPAMGEQIPQRARIAGIGGLVFVALVIAQNLIRAGSLPADDAAPGTIVRLYSSHSWTTPALFVMFVVSAFGLVAFSGVLLDRLRAPGSRWLALGGGIGVVMIAALFPMTVALDTALAVYIRRGTPSGTVVEALWIIHNSVFGVLQLALGIALGGWSIAARRNGLVSAGWQRAGVFGGLSLAVASAATPAVLDGNPIMALGLVGFVIWLAFVARVSVALLRDGSPTTNSL